MLNLFFEVKDFSNVIINQYAAGKSNPYLESLINSFEIPEVRLDDLVINKKYKA